MRPWMLVATLSAGAVAVLAPVVALFVGGLAVAANVAQLVSVPLAAIALAPVIYSFVSPSAPGGTRRFREAALTAAPIVVVAVGVIWAALIVTQGDDPNDSPPRAGGPGGGPVSTPAIPTPDGPADRGAQLDSEWIDTFSGAALDPERWRPFANPEILRVEGGQLRFAVQLSGDARPINRKILQPILPGWPVSQVQARVSVTQNGGLLAGGVLLFVEQQSGRVTGFAYGPSPAGPTGGPWLCHRDEGCGAESNNFDQSGRFLFQEDRSIDVTITQTGRALQVRAGDLQTEADADPSPIENVWLQVDAAPTDDWTATLDELRLTRAG